MSQVANTITVPAGKTVSVLRSLNAEMNCTVRWQSSLLNKQPIVTQTFGRVQVSNGVGDDCHPMDGSSRHSWTCDADYGVLSIDGGMIALSATAPDNADMLVTATATSACNAKTQIKYTQRITENVVTDIPVTWASELFVWGNSSSAISGTNTQVRLYSAFVAESADFITFVNFPTEAIKVPGGVDRVWVTSTEASVVHVVWQLTG